MDSEQFYVTVEGAIYKDGKWLMIVRSEKESHAAGLLSMAGGTVSYSDPLSQTLEEALKREIQEEVGLTVSGPFTYITSSHFMSDIGERVINIVLATAYTGDEPAIPKEDEVAGVEWMSFEEIESHPKTPVWILESMRLAEDFRLNQKLG